MGKVRKTEHFEGGGNRFTNEIVISESVSIQEDLSSGDLQKDEKINYYEKREEKYFNIMLLGATGTGKTTFMECFLRQYKQKNNKEHIKKETDKVYYEKVMTQYEEPSLNMNILDTPGYDKS